MNEESKRKYYDVITTSWRIFKACLPRAEHVYGEQDPRWQKILVDLESIYNSAPGEQKHFAYGLMRTCEEELEKIWRERKNDR